VVVNIESNGLNAVGTKITDTDGQEIRGAIAADISISLDHLNKAAIKLYVKEVKVKAESVFVMRHPLLNDDREVAEIKFTDGSVFNTAKETLTSATTKE
jgi:citrate lyase alpha subunit